MKKNKLIYQVAFLFAAAVLISSVPTAYAAYNDVYFPVSVPIRINALGIDVYVRTGSSAASVTVANDSISFAMESGSLVIVRSDGRKNLDNNLGSFTCTADYSEAYLASTKTETLTITPSSATCEIPPVTQAGSGGGGGVGGSVAVTPTVTTPTVTPTPATTPATTPAAVTPVTPQVTVQTPVSSAAAPSFTRPLAVGAQGSDVQQLQMTLLREGVYPEGRITGTFGVLTNNAVKRFQEKYGIANSGDAGYGTVGPMTRAKLNELTSGSAAATAPAASTNVAALQSQIQALQQQLVQLLAQLANQLKSQVSQ